MTATRIEQAEEPDAHVNRALRVAGVAAIVAAALGSILVATPAMPDAGSQDDECRISIVGGDWLGRGCQDSPDATDSR